MCDDTIAELRREIEYLKQQRHGWDEAKLRQDMRLKELRQQIAAMGEGESEWIRMAISLRKEIGLRQQRLEAAKDRENVLKRVTEWDAIKLESVIRERNEAKSKLVAVSAAYNSARNQIRMLEQRISGECPLANRATGDST